MGLLDVIKKGAFVDILRGMSVTGTYFATGKVTVSYPWEKIQPYPRFRGVHALLTDPETGDSKCVACMLCPTICPSGCIHVTGEVTATGRSHAATFDLDLSRCIFCGLCEEVCPVAAIVMTQEYELATFNKDELWLTKERLMANAENARKEVFTQVAEEELVEPAAAHGAAASGPPTTKPAGALRDGPAPQGQFAVPIGQRPVLKPGVQEALYEAEPARRPRPDVEVPAAAKPEEPGTQPPGIAEGKAILRKVARRRVGMLP